MAFGEKWFIMTCTKHVFPDAWDDGEVLVKESEKGVYLVSLGGTRFWIYCTVLYDSRV